MMIFKMLHRLIEKGLYEVDDILQKLDVYFLTDTITEQEYNTLYEMIYPQKIEEENVNDLQYVVEND